MPYLSDDLASFKTNVSLQSGFSPSFESGQKVTTCSVADFASMLTFFEQPNSLAVGKDALDVDADRALWRVLASNNGESETFLARTFLETHILDAVALTLALAR